MEMKIKHIIAATVIAASAVISAASYNWKDNAVTSYTTRIVGMDSRSVPGSIVYTYKSGNETWQATNAVQRMAIQTTPSRYSKLKIIVAAKKAGKWNTVKEFITNSDLTDEWNACQYIEDGNAYFVEATNKVVQAGIATSDEIKSFLEAAKDTDL